MSVEMSNRSLTIGGGRFAGLDILRVFLALLIYMFHAHTSFECDFFIFNDFVDVGAIAMTGFFILSGYCLHISSSHKDLSKLAEIKTFYLKRLITVLPLYYFIAIMYTIWATFEGLVSVRDNIILFPVETLGLQSVFSSLFGVSHNGGTWFISCILICYAVYPFIQQLLSQIGSKSKLFMAIVFCGILFYAPFVRKAFHLQEIYTNPFFRLLEFTIGVIVAQLNYASVNNKILDFLKTRTSLIILSVFFFVAVTFARRIGVPADYMLYD